MKTLNKPRIQAVREKYARNQAYIQKGAKLSVYEYNLFQYETGLIFLEDQYPTTTPVNKFYPKFSTYMKDANRKIVSDRTFWLWFMSEWKEWESELTQFFKFNKTNFDQGLWKQEMQQMALDSKIEDSFHLNYIKIKNDKK